MIYIWKWLSFDCGPAEVVCVCWSVDWKSLSWLEGCFWSLRGIGHIQFVLLNGSFCESSPNVLIFPSVSCHNDDWMQPSFVLLGWHMLHFAPPYHDLALFIPFSFLFLISLLFFMIYFAALLWIYCTCYVVFSGRTGSYPPHCHVYLYICATIIPVSLTLMCIINSVCVSTLPVPLIYCIVCGSCVHIW